MRNFEEICELFRVVEPEQVRDGSNHEHFEGNRIVFAKLVVKKRKKPGKFLDCCVLPSALERYSMGSDLPTSVTPEEESR